MTLMDKDVVPAVAVPQVAAHKGSAARMPTHPFNVFSEQKVTSREACEFLRWKNPTSTPSAEELEEARVLLESLQEKVQDKATKLLKNQCFLMAKREGILHKDNKSLVNDFDQVKDSFREQPTYEKCRILFSVLYTWTTEEDGRQWLKGLVSLVKDDCDIVYPEPLPEGKVGVCAVGKILMKKSLVNVRAVFKKDSVKGQKVGLTAKKGDNHPMGDPQTMPGHHFQPQNIQGWANLVAVCPKAREMDLAHKIKSGEKTFEAAIHGECGYVRTQQKGDAQSIDPGSVHGQCSSRNLGISKPSLPPVSTLIVPPYAAARFPSTGSFPRQPPKMQAPNNQVRLVPPSVQEMEDLLKLAGVDFSSSATEDATLLSSVQDEDITPAVAGEGWESVSESRNENEVTALMTSCGPEME